MIRNISMFSIFDKFVHAFLSLTDRNYDVLPLTFREMSFAETHLPVLNVR